MLRNAPAHAASVSRAAMCRPRASLSARPPPQRSFCHPRRSRVDCHSHRAAQQDPRSRHHHFGLDKNSWISALRNMHSLGITISRAVKDSHTPVPPLGAWSDHNIRSATERWICPHGAKALSHVIKRCVSSVAKRWESFDSGVGATFEPRRQATYYPNAACGGFVPPNYQPTRPTPPPPPSPSSSSSPSSAGTGDTATKQTTNPVIPPGRSFAYYIFVFPFEVVLKAVIISAFVLVMGATYAFLAIAVICLLVVSATEDKSKTVPKGYVTPSIAAAPTVSKASPRPVAVVCTPPKPAPKIPSPTTPAPAPAATVLQEEAVIARAAEAVSRIVRSLGL